MWKRWIPWKFIVKRTAKAYGFIDPISLLARLRRFAQPSEIQEPIELLRAGTVFHARGLINTKAIQHNLDWIWPYWVERQFNPEDNSFIPRAFSFSHVNLTHRNWTAVGQPGYNLYPIVDPRGMVTPLFDGWSLDFWIVSDSKKHLIPSRQKECEQALAFQPEIEVQTSLATDTSSLQSHVKMLPDKYGARLVINIYARAASRDKLVLAIRPYNPEGIQFVEDIEYYPEISSIYVNNATKIELEQKPEKVLFSDYQDGDVFHKLHEEGRKRSMSCKVGMATAAAVFDLQAENRAGRYEFNIPLVSDRKIPVSSRASKGLSWRKSLQETTGIQIPDARLSYLFQAAKSTLTLLSSREVVPGPYTYKRFWFRDACFMLNAMLSLGMFEQSREAIESFPERQKASGYFQSQEGEWDSNGQVLWIVDRFLKITGKVPSKKLLAAVQKGVAWLKKMRVSPNSGQAHAGLLPPGFSAEHLGPNDYYYWDNFWALAGIKSASSILGKFQSPDLEKELNWLYADFEQSIFNSIHSVSSRRNMQAIPASPYRRLDAGAIGSMVADYPLQLFEPGNPLILNTARYLLQNCFHDGGFFQDMIHSGINAYLTLCLAQTLLRHDMPEFKGLIEAVANLASSTGQWPEAVHPITKGGCMGDGQHGWAAAEWIMMLRNLFVREEGDSLILGSGLFPEWLETKADISFGPVFTPFSKISLNMKDKGEGLQVEILTEQVRSECTLILKIPGFEEKSLPHMSQEIILRPVQK